MYFYLIESLGDPIPPKVPGKLRLYSMKYCPYAERVRIVLLAKNIPHDIVNVNLKDKPEWLFELHPEGRLFFNRLLVSGIKIRVI